MYPLFEHATSLVRGLSSLSGGEPSDDLIVACLVRNLDGRYELRAAGAALRVRLGQIIDAAESPGVAEEDFDKLFDQLEAIGAGLQIPGAESLQLERISLCVRTGSQDSLTPLGTWLRNGFRAATTGAGTGTIPFAFGPAHAFGVRV